MTPFVWAMGSYSSSDIQDFLGLKALFIVPMLCYAAYQDLENRELDASTWASMLILGISMITLEFTPTMLPQMFLKLTQSIALLTMFLLLGLYELGDALILIGICLAHVSTSRPLLGGHFLKPYFPDFSLTVLLNSEIFSLTTMLSNLIHNLRSGAWNTLAVDEPFQKKVFCMLFLRTVGQGLDARKGHATNHSTFVKRTIPVVLFILPGYVVALIFGSLLPLPG